MRTAGIVLGTVLVVFSGYVLFYSNQEGSAPQDDSVRVEGNELVKAPILGTDISGLQQEGLVDQEGEPIQVERLRGQPVLISFIYTSCPDANMCPLITRKMKQVQDEVNRTDALNARFVSVTFDPETDTPQTLKHYGEQKNVDFRNWSFLTGSRETIDPLLDLFQITAQKKEDQEGVYLHNMRTYLLSADLVVRNAWKGSRWKVETVLQKLKALQSDG